MEANPSDKYVQLLDAYIKPALAQSGFKRKAQNFYVAFKEVYGLISFQKSIKSNSERIVFTVNLGLSSRRLLKEFSKDVGASKLRIDDCHWRERLGFILDGRDIWWEICSHTNLMRLGEELTDDLQQKAIPEMKKYVNDQALCELWLTGRSPGLTNFERLINLSFLAKDLGHPDIVVERVIEELLLDSKGKPSAGAALLHIRKLKKKEDSIG